MVNEESFHIYFPQCTKLEYGTEPSLYEVLVKYYTSAMPLEKAKECADQYIKAWLKMVD